MVPTLLGQEISRRTSPQNHRVLTAVSRRQSAVIAHHRKAPPSSVIQFRGMVVRGAIHDDLDRPRDRIDIGDSRAMAKWPSR
jgi:hypothetical protein